MTAMTSVSETPVAVRTYGHHIDGVRRAPSEHLITRDNPADGTPLARFSAGTPGEAEEAIAAARRAFDSGPWPRLTAMERARVLLDVARGLREEADLLARLDAEESGKPLACRGGRRRGQCRIVRVCRGTRDDVAR